MQYLLQPKCTESILQTTEAVERWECDLREHEERFGKTLDEDVKTGVILALAPPQVHNHYHLNSHILKSYAQVTTVLFDFCRAQRERPLVTLYPWISRWGVKVKARKVKATKMRRTKNKDKKGIGKDKTTANTKATECFAGYCPLCNAWGYMQKDCCWNESAKSGKDTASLENPITPVVDTTTEPPITEMSTVR